MLLAFWERVSEQEHAVCSVSSVEQCHSGFPFGVMRISESSSGDGRPAVNAPRAARLCTLASGLSVGRSGTTRRLGPAVLNGLWKPRVPWLRASSSH